MMLRTLLFCRQLKLPKSIQRLLFESLSANQRPGMPFLFTDRPEKNTQTWPVVEDFEYMLPAVDYHKPGLTTPPLIMYSTCSIRFRNLLMAFSQSVSSGLSVQRFIPACRKGPRLCDWAFSTAGQSVLSVRVRTIRDPPPPSPGGVEYL